MDDPAAPDAVPAEAKPDDSETDPVRPAPMGWDFYLVMALIGVMIFLIIFLNVPATRASAAATLSTGNWTLSMYADESGALAPVLNGTQVTARFVRDGFVSGSAGCNQYTAGYTVKDYTLNITAPRSTKMNCPRPGIMEQENLYLSNLANAKAFRIHDPNLDLYDAMGRITLVFGPSAS